MQHERIKKTAPEPTEADGHFLGERLKLAGSILDHFTAAFYITAGTLDGVTAAQADSA